ncbi:MAG: hypothetical protein ACHQQ3_07845 [Gemmatimonadales bacterium]
MGSRSQGIRLLRSAAGQGIRILLGAAVVVVASAVAWKALTAPGARPKAKPPVSADRTGPGYLVVAAEAVDIDVIAPDGRHTTTGTHADSAARADSTTLIPESSGTVDCAGYGRSRESDSACSANVMLQHPAFGTYRVVIASTDSVRGEAVTVGYGGATFSRNGGFTVHVVARPGRPAEFVITLAAEGASLRSEPKPNLP